MQRALRRASVALISLIICWSLFVVPGFAQDRSLPAGAILSDELNPDQLARVFLLRSVGDESVEVTVINEANANLAIILADAQGNTLAQASGEPNSTTLSANTGAAGNFYLTVFALGDSASEVIPFTITRADSAPPEETVSATESGYPSTPVLSSGMDIDLNWDNTVNFDLEVRDPIGGSLYWLNPAVPSGGVLPANRNGSCELLQSAQPERASWPSGTIPSGSYEILVYYQQDCQGSGESEFSIEVRINGEYRHQFSGRLSEGGIYIGRFVVREDGSSSLGLHGAYEDPALSPLGAWNLSASSIRANETVAGAITNSNYAGAYEFSAVAGDVVTVDLVATDGNLDPLLALYDQNGNLVAANDDRDDETTNSSIRLRTLPISGSYTIIASRYGGALGGTEGSFNLTLSQQSSETVAELAALNLPSGDVEVSLLWDTAADLQLLMRDPRSNSIYDDFPTTSYGASLALAGNVGCSTDLASPVSHIYWPTGSAIPGWYEVDIWYQDSCGDNRPVTLALYISIRGQLLFSTNVPIEPGQHYITSFQLNLDGGASMGAGGIFNDLDALDYGAQLANAQAITSGQALGTILPARPYQLYTFSGNAGDVVTISMTATAGTLDTLLYLIDPNGFVIGKNDDAIAGETTDSLLSDIVLPDSGDYLIIATRYGILFGGTEGPYSLSLLSR